VPIKKIGTSSSALGHRPVRFPTWIIHEAGSRLSATVDFEPPVGANRSVNQPVTDVIENERRARRRSLPRGWPVLVALLVMMTGAAAVLTFAALHYKHLADRTPTRGTSDGHDAAAPHPTVTQWTYHLLHKQVTVHLLTILVPGADTGQVLVTGQVTDGVPSRRYELTGGNCAAARTYTWAQGTTGDRGETYLGGPVWTLPAAAQYYLTVQPAPTAVGPDAAITGIEGSWLQGPSTSILGRTAPCN
jgi:hypothetical protein